MKYSAVLIALFAATALAAPATADTSSVSATKSIRESTNNSAEETTNSTDETIDNSADETDENNADENTHDNRHNDHKDGDEWDNGKSGHDNYQPTYDDAGYTSYKPVKQSCYVAGEEDEYNTKYGKDMYFAKDAEYVKKYNDYSIAEDFDYPEQIDTGSYCPITYTPKDKSYKGAYKVALCHSDDGYKACEDICHDEYSCKQYKPKDDCIPSDASGHGRMYKFKVYYADEPEKCTYSKALPIYNPVYYEKTKSVPEPALCPPPKYVIKAPEPSYSPAAPVAPSAPAAPAAPAAPVDNGAKPETSYAPANETSSASSPAAPAPVALSAATSVKATFSAIVGIAAVVAFAL